MSETLCFILFGALERSGKEWSYPWMNKQIALYQLSDFARQLQEDERSPATIENYLRHIRAFAAWAGGQAVTKDLATQWKEHLISQYRPGTVNTMLKE